MSKKRTIEKITEKDDNIDDYLNQSDEIIFNRIFTKNHQYPTFNYLLYKQAKDKIDLSKFKNELIIHLKDWQEYNELFTLIIWCGFAKDQDILEAVIKTNKTHLMKGLKRGSLCEKNTYSCDGIDNCVEALIQYHKNKNYDKQRAATVFKRIFDDYDLRTSLRRAIKYNKTEVVEYLIEFVKEFDEDTLTMQIEPLKVDNKIVDMIFSGLTPAEIWYTFTDNHNFKYKHY